MMPLVPALLIHASVFAQTTTWDGAGIWNDANSWDNGIPDGTTDAIVTKTGAGAQDLTIPTGVAFKTLNLQNSFSGLLTTYTTNGTSGTSVNLSATDVGRVRFISTGPINISGAMNLFSTSTDPHSASLQVNPGTTLTVGGGVTFGSNNAANRTTYLTHATLTGVTTVNANLTFHKGSQYWSQGNSPSGILNINGNVTLQAGTSTGQTPSFNVGRAAIDDNGFKVNISNHLAVTDAGSVTIWKGKSLEVGSASFTSGGVLEMRGYDTMTNNAVFRSIGDLSISGATLRNNNSAGDSGEYIMEIGGDFILGSGSTLSLSSNALGRTTMKLKGNFDLQATTVSSGNLNELHLTLEGTGLQLLETAVTNSVNRFTIHTLTFDNSLVSLTDTYTNFASDEYFKTSNLINIGDTTLNLNGLQFFVGETELTEGIYNLYGGTLTVIPEPSAILLMLGTFAGTFILHRKK